MSDYDNTNRGSLFKNDKGNNPNRPDYTGKINVGGTDYRLSAWIKEAKSGKKYMSLSVKEDDSGQQRQQSPPQRKSAPAGSNYGTGDSETPDLHDDDIPF